MAGVSDIPESVESVYYLSAEAVPAARQGDFPKALFTYQLKTIN